MSGYSRHEVEIEENLGKILVFDVETGHYEIDSDGILANRRLIARYLGTDPYKLFAISNSDVAVFANGSTVTQTGGK